MSTLLHKKLSPRERLRQLADGWLGLKAPPGAWITEEFLARVGIECMAQPLPGNYPRMTPNLCFQNTLELVRSRRNLRYCEGVFLMKDLPIMIVHAWAIDRENRVIDPTLKNPENYEFVGYPMSLAERRKWVTRDCSSVLDTYRGRNAAFMTRHCPDLLAMIDKQYHPALLRA